MANLDNATPPEGGPPAQTPDGTTNPPTDPPPGAESPLFADPKMVESDTASSRQEETLWTGRPHWHSFAPSLLGWLAGSSALSILMIWAAGKFDDLSGAVAFWIAAVPILGSGLVVASRVVVGVYGRRFRLTTERLFIHRGLLSRTIDQSELIRVDDVRVSKTFVNRLFGLGTVEILSTDTSDKSLQVPGIKNPDEVAEAVRDSMRTLRKKKSVFVESL